MNDNYARILEYTDSLINTPYYLDILLAQFARLSSKESFDATHSRIKEQILSIISSCDEEYQTIFYTYLLVTYDYTHNLKEMPKTQKLCRSLTYNDNNLKAIYYYHSYSCDIKQSKLNDAIESYNKAKDLFTLTNNTKKLSNLRIIYSHYLQSIGLINEAIKDDIETLNELIEKQYRLTNIGVLYNNIAWGYFLLKKFSLAKEYYLKAIEYFPDNETYFCLAYSYFKLDDLNNSLNTIEKGKHVNNAYSYYFDLLDWLESFINKPYNKKAAGILLKILDHDNGCLSSSSRKFIYAELVNYYQHCHDYQNAFYFSKLLLEMDLICPVALLSTPS